MVSWTPGATSTTSAAIPPGPSQTYRELYERGEIPARVVEVFPKECWQVQPLVYEDEDPDTATEFEERWDEVGKNLLGPNSKYQDEAGSPIWEYLSRADVLSGIGQYGVILLGLDDDNGGDLRNPVAGVGEAFSAPTGKKIEKDGAETDVKTEVAGNYRMTVNAAKTEGRNLLYLRVFPEWLAQVIQFETNPTSPRFGQPVMYNLTFNDPGASAHGGIGQPMSTRMVHWTRLVHLADTHHTAPTNETFAVPRMQPVLNRLLDLRKMYGADGEGYWKNAFAQLFFETHPQLGGDVDVDQEGMRDVMESMENGLQRWALLLGMSAKTVPPQLTDPTPHVNIQIEAICVKLSIPVPVFKGYEIGEQASQNNKVSWTSRVRERRNNYLTPRLIIPFVDRLVMVGVLPEPEGYSVEWPEAETQTPLEKAQVAGAKTTALAAYVQGGVEAIIPPLPYLTSILGYDEEEAREILDEAEKAEEEKLAEQQALADEQGMVPAPPDGFQSPEAEQPVNPFAVKPGEKLVHPRTGKTVAKGDKLPAANVFCPTGEGGGVDPSCSPSGTAVSEAKSAMGGGDQAAIDRVIGKIKEAGAGRRSELTVKGLREVAKGIGVTGHSKLLKAGLSQAIQDKLKAAGESSPQRDLASRLERVSNAEKWSGVRHEDKVVEGLIAIARDGGLVKSNEYRSAYADIRQNKEGARKESITYMKALRENMHRDLKEGNVPEKNLAHVLEAISPDAGQLSPAEFKERLKGGTPTVKAAKGLIPSDLKLQPASRGGPITRARERAAAGKKSQPDYIDRLRAPKKDRDREIKEKEETTKMPFAARVVNEVMAGQEHLEGKHEYVSLVTRVSSGAHVSADDKRRMSSFRASVVAKIKFGDIGQERVLAALEAVDKNGYGTMRVHEFMKRLERK